MKKIVLLVTAMFAMAAFAQNSLNLVFTGVDQHNHYVRINSVNIENLTRGWSETILFPDTVYTLEVGSDVSEHWRNGEMQVMPNPFDGQTLVNISSAQDGPVTMVLVDINGKRCATYSGILLRGDNFFEISLTTPQVYVLSVTTPSGTRSLKMVNQGHAGNDRIWPDGNAEMTAKVDLKSTSTHDFQLGDEMRYTGYASKQGHQVQSVVVTQPQYVSEEFRLLFDMDSVSLMIVTTDSIFIENHDLHCYGTVTASDAVTERGFCWSTLPHPTIANDYTIEGNSTGSFSSTLTGLDPHQAYYLRAYATNNDGMIYGNEFHIRISNSYTQIDTAFLPDGLDCGNGCSYISSVNVTGFPDSTMMQSANDISFVRIKLEHSWIGDLWIRLTCPNQQFVSIMRKYNSGTSSCSIQIPSSEWGWTGSGITGAFFGLPVDETGSNKCDPTEYANRMGTPWNYCWSNATDQGYVYSPNNYVYVGGQSNVPIDSTDVVAMTNVYHPDVSFANLIGCPMNGTWSIEVMDGWSVDNGWITEWELSFNGMSTETVSPEVTGACPGAESVTDYDGNSYPTVKIGDYCWMKENLRTTHYASGASITQGSGADADAAHFYLPAVTGTDTFGYLYNWKAVTGQDGGGQGICPDGWHVPRDAEWTQLTDFMGSIEGYVCGDNPNNIARALAADTFWNLSANPCAVGSDLSLNNASGFSALPAGLFNGTSGQLGANACFWTATSNNDYACYRSMSYDNGFVERNLYGDKAFGMSVRCVLSEAPKVTTAAVTNIADSTAMCGGEVISIGGAPVTEKGLCWNASTYPTVSDAHVACGAGIGTFTGQMTGLEPNTVYYVRAYATSAAGTVYGTFKTFTTLTIPTVTTQIVENIWDSTATCGGNVTSDGGAPMTARGVCWSNTQDPTIADSHTTDGAGTGLFSSQMTGLVPNTAYYVRAYASNAFGTAYGEQRTFTTKAIPTVSLSLTNVLSTTATCTYLISDFGGMPVTDRGVCYSTLPYPTLNDNVVAGMGDNSTVELTGLTPGTTYYVRAYATNAIGTGYSDLDTITTLIIPTLTTVAASDISFFSATSGGEVLATGVSEITARGVCWSTTQNPTIANSHTSDGTGFGAFTSQLTGLDLHTTYYVRAYATNSSGTGYGNQITFTTLNIPAVTTKTVTSILDSTAVCGGNITSDGGGTILAKGICWSTGSMPTIDDSIATDTGSLNDYTCTMTGLIPNTTYHVRAFATNGGGTAYGSQRTFTTKAIPTVTLDSATSILSLTASCTYHVTNNGGMSVTARGVCYDTTANPTIDDNVVAGTGNNGTVQLSGLVPGTTYYARAFATNGAGTGYSNEISFTTLTIPSLTTADVSDVAFFTATGGGEVLATGVSDILVRGLCWSTSQNPTIADSHSIDSIPADSTGFGTFTSQMTGLLPGTTYYVRAYAINSYGTGYGNQVSFTTLQIPTVITKSVTNITDSSATCGGNITSTGGGAILAKGICWSTMESPTIADSIAVDTTTQNNFSRAMTGLTPGTTYYVRAFATNGGGTSYGSQKTFTTKSTPKITLDSATNVSSVTASCSYHIISNGGVSLTDRGICYSTSPNPTTNDNVIALSANNGTVQLSGLTPGTTYYVRVFATNSFGTAYSNEISFTTLSIPTVTTAEVSDVAFFTATCGGEVLATGVPAIIVRGVCWSTSPNPTIADSLTNDGTGFGMFTSQLTGLEANTTYYLRAYAMNSSGTAYGEERTFTTIQSPTVILSEITNISSHSARGWFDVYPNGSSLSVLGICYSTSPNPTTNDSIFVYETNTTFGFAQRCPIDLTGLIPNTTYYARIFATIGNSAAYSNELSFTTPIVPTVSTAPPTNVVQSSATLNGIITNPDNVSLTSGFEYRRSTDSIYSIVNAIGDTMTHYLISLPANTTYSYRAFLTTVEGTTYGNEFSFTTLSADGDSQPCPGLATVTDHQGNIYNTVLIGSQCWTKENMRCTTSPKGHLSSCDNNQNANFACYYNDPSFNIPLEIRGLTYNWAGALDTTFTAETSSSFNCRRGICPEGWHIPSIDDWNTLTNYLRGQDMYICNNNPNLIAKALASSEYWDSCDDYTGGFEGCLVCYDVAQNNSTGFSITPAGAYLWSSTSINSSDAYPFSIYGNSPFVFSYGSDKAWGHSVRCVHGDESEFPSVTTIEASDITLTSATCGGQVSYANGADVIARGICWSTSSNPTVNGTHTTNGAGTGTFSYVLTDLQPLTTYYVRAYATNSSGTIYGNEVSFKTRIGNDAMPCPGFETVTDIDNNVYNTVNIGDQCWMKENLRTTRFADGTVINISINNSGSYTIPYRYCPDNDAGNVPTYGYMYNWPAVMHGSASSYANPSGVQGICPNGWHVPSQSEFYQLINYVRSQSVYCCDGGITKALASNNGWASLNEYIPCAPGWNWNGNNATGFSALPEGFFQNYDSGDGVYGSFGLFTNYWSCTESLSQNAYSLWFGYGMTDLPENPQMMKNRGHSVRCIRDE